MIVSYFIMDNAVITHISLIKRYYTMTQHFLSHFKLMNSFELAFSMSFGLL